MKNFKFRAWSKEREEMINECDLSITPDGSVLAGDLNYNEESGMLADVTDNVVITMSTGLKDKNGVEIYEGDIIEFEDESFCYPFDDEAIVETINRAQVIIDKVKGIFLENFMVKDSTIAKEYKYYYDLPTSEKTIFFKECSVVGNVFEDENLLEDE